VSILRSSLLKSNKACGYPKLRMRVGNVPMFTLPKALSRLPNSNRARSLILLTRHAQAILGA
jgi:hypothetical protein